MSWEDTFINWAESPSKTEQEKADNAKSVIESAIRASDELSRNNISIFAHGSYKARTNINQDSDVDLVVCLHSTFYFDLPEGKTREDFGLNSPSERTYSSFKNQVVLALNNRFGPENVERGNKAIEVHENTYRVHADVLPAFEHRRYTSHDIYGEPIYHKGIKFLPDNGGRVVNWPKQSYENGKKTNKNSQRRYKKVVRIFKNLRNRMQEDGIEAAEGISSCLFEHLGWNVPMDRYLKDTHDARVRAVLAYTHNNTLNQDSCKEWGEINDLKYLFRPGQPWPGQDWSREKTNEFLKAAWDYVGYE